MVSTIPDNQEIRRIDSHPVRKVTGLHLSPDGQFVARLETGRRLRVWRVADGNPVLVEAPAGCSGVAFSPDGRQLVFCRSNWVHRIDLATGRELNRWQIEGTAYWLTFAPDHRQMAVGYVESEVASVYDMADGRLVANLPVGQMTEQVAAWHS